MLSVILLICAVCCDSFAAAISYGAAKIRIPFLSALIISLSGAATLSVGLILSSVLKGGFKPETAVIISAGLLTAIGFIGVIKGLAGLMMKKRALKKTLDGIYAVDVLFDSTKADRDNSHDLSVIESAALAAALSIDSLATGFSAGLGMTEWQMTAAAVLTAAVCQLSVIGGDFIGKRLSRKIKADLSILSGAVLIIIGVLRLIWR